MDWSVRCSSGPLRRPGHGVGDRKLQTLAAPLQLTESGSGTIDYLPTSGMLLELRHESGRVLWSRFSGLMRNTMPIGPPRLITPRYTLGLQLL